MFSPIDIRPLHSFCHSAYNQRVELIACLHLFNENEPVIVKGVYTYPGWDIKLIDSKPVLFLHLDKVVVKTFNMEWRPFNSRRVERGYKGLGFYISKDEIIRIIKFGALNLEVFSNRFLLPETENKKLIAAPSSNL